MKILITGAGGYIGSILIMKLLNLDHSVIAIDRFFFGDSLPQHSKLKKIKADSRDLDRSIFKYREYQKDHFIKSNGGYYKVEHSHRKLILMHINKLNFLNNLSIF